MRKPVKFKTKNGFPTLPRRKGARPATLELVNRLRESDVEEFIRDYRRMAGLSDDSRTDDDKESSSGED
jgi:hypothetical protein